MLRQILYFGFSFLFNLSLAHAATWENLQSFKWPTCTIPQNEWRVGIGIGVEYVNHDAKVKYDFTEWSKQGLSNRDQTQKQFQITPSLEVGKTSFNNYYTGIVASWHYSSPKKQTRDPFKNASYFTHQFKMSYYFDILAKLGYKVTPNTMAYLLVGPSIAKWSHTTNVYTQKPTHLQLNGMFKASHTSVGLGLGLGVEHVICKGVAVGINYTHHFYKKSTKQKYMEYPDLKGLREVMLKGTFSKTIKPSSDAIMLHLAYFF